MTTIQTQCFDLFQNLVQPSNNNNTVNIKRFVENPTYLRPFAHDKIQQKEFASLELSKSMQNVDARFEFYFEILNAMIYYGHKMFFLKSQKLH